MSFSVTLKLRRRSILFFFSSRRRHKRYWRDWSSDVCSSDLLEYCTGMSHPPKSTILAPEPRCMALSGVDLREAGDDIGKGQSNRRRRIVSNGRDILEIFRDATSRFTSIP